MVKRVKIEDVLPQIPFFSDLTEIELRQLINVGQHLLCRDADEVLFCEGDPGDTLYVILAGRVRIYRTNEDDSEVELATLTCGDYFGELSLIDGEPRSARVATLEPCEFFLLDRRDFLDALSASRQMLDDILVGLSGKIRRG